MPERKSICRLINSIDKMKHHVIKHAIKSGKLTEKEYASKYEGKYHDDDGIDSFIQYLDAVMKGGDMVFVTVNEKILRDKTKLEDKFGTRILHPHEAIEELEVEEAVKFAERMNVIAA